VTDLEWITDGRQLAAVVLGRNAETAVTDLAVMDCAPRGPVARLTITDKGRLLVNNQDEEREDFIALVGVFEEVEDADLPAGSVAYLGTWDDEARTFNGPDYLAANAEHEATEQRP
jgi:hypothetical protein